MFSHDGDNRPESKPTLCFVGFARWRGTAVKLLSTIAGLLRLTPFPMFIDFSMFMLYGKQDVGLSREL